MGKDIKSSAASVQKLDKLAVTQIILFGVFLVYTVAVFLIPEGTLFPPENGISLKSGLMISGAIVCIFLAVLTLTSFVIGMSVNNPIIRKTILIIILVVTAGLLFLHGLAWINGLA